jgi:epsilon-lactone hydrolase
MYVPQARSEAPGIGGLMRRLAEVAPKPGDTVDQMRRTHEAAIACVPIPSGVTITAERVGPLDAEWVVPSDGWASPGRVVLYLHGGGYVIGSPAGSRPLAANLALAVHTPLLSLAYRLAPESPFPAAVDDASATIEWLLSRGLSAGNIVIGGDSAGGGLAVAAMLALRERGAALPRAGFCLSPWADLRLPPGSLDAPGLQDPMVARWLLAEMAGLYLGGADPATPLASPALADLAGLPPLLIQVGGGEKLLDDSASLAQAARTRDVPVTLERWDGMFHVWHAFAPKLPQAVDALASLGRWFAGIWA